IDPQDFGVFRLVAVLPAERDLDLFVGDALLVEGDADLRREEAQRTGVERDLGHVDDLLADDRGRGARGPGPIRAGRGEPLAGRLDAARAALAHPQRERARARVVAADGWSRARRDARG